MYKEAWNLISDHQNIVLITHINPDGDTLGSALALYPILKDMGKHVSVVNTTKNIANRYDFLPNFSKIRPNLPVKMDLLISLDCGSYDRLGISKPTCPVINIDHHKTNDNFGDINLVDASMPSASCVVLKLLQENKISLRRDVATCIYTALAEDTGFFSFENVNAKTFEIAAQLISAKADPAYIAKMLKEREPLAKLRLTALMTNNLQLIHNATIGYSIISLEDFNKTGAMRSDSDECVDLIRSLATVELAILLIEETDGYKISLRSKSDIDVSSIALCFGGGGHKRAAGFSSSEQNTNKIIKEIVKKVTV